MLSKCACVCVCVVENCGADQPGGWSFRQKRKTPSRRVVLCNSCLQQWSWLCKPDDIAGTSVVLNGALARLPVADQSGAAKSSAAVVAAVRAAVRVAVGAAVGAAVVGAAVRAAVVGAVVGAAVGAAVRTAVVGAVAGSGGSMTALACIIQQGMTPLHRADHADCRRVGGARRVCWS